MPTGDYVLSVVVGTLNRLDRLRDCIESIVCNTSIPTRLYVTDAGSTDGTIEYLSGIESDSIRVILHQAKLGQARAYNEIFSIITTPYTCWLSDDNTIVNRGIERAVGILDVNPRIGMVGLKVKDVQGPFLGEPYIGGISETGILNVNQGVLRTALLQNLGGFSEEFMSYGIDPDLTARVLYSGHDIVFTKQIAVLHYRDWGMSDTLRAQFAKQEKYQALYREKYFRTEGRAYPSVFLRRIAGGIKRVIRKSAGLLGTDKANHLARDCYNIILGQYISWFDPIRSMGQDYHLLQRCDRETAEYYASHLRQAD